MTVSPLSLGELYVWWSALTVLALAGLAVGTYAAWNSRRNRRLLLGMHRWAEGVDPHIVRVVVAKAADETPTDDFAEVLIREAFEEPEPEKVRPTPHPRVATVGRKLGDRTFQFRANTAGVTDTES